MDWLRIIGAVDQSSSGVGTVDPSGFEIRRYDYRLNPKGRVFAQNTAGRHQDLWEKVQKAADSLSKAGDMDYASLSIAAKTYFLLDQKRGPASREELRRLAARFGWDVSPEQIEAAAGFPGEDSGSLKSRLMTRLSHNDRESLMSRPKLLIEQWLPIEAIGAECMRERGSRRALPPLTAYMFGGHDDL